MADITKNSNVKNPPQALTMLDVQAIANRAGGYAKSCRFIVRIMPVGDLLRKKIVARGTTSMLSELSYMCEATEMPGRGFMNLDNRYHGPNFKIPFQTQYEDLSMTFLCRAGSQERQFFDDWMETINPTNLWDFNYRDTYTALVHIYQLADFPEKVAEGASLPRLPAPVALYQWTLHDAYPILVNPQAVTWADDNFQRVTVSMTYTKWTRPEPLDKTPTSYRSSSSFISGSTSRNVNFANLPAPPKI